MPSSGRGALVCRLIANVFCVTFYSFKGGVGRTLALANVAASLAESGRRVLVVDFDLEAPGLTSFPAFATARKIPGVVDYVCDYLRNGRAPNAADYIGSCELIFSENDEDTGELYERSISIDVMPAGQDGDEGYATRLCNLDWGQLYSAHNGFLLMEDLRAQWQNAGYDYVLIDSRTGHTDVGGICTRQLPDAVVALFFPNEQNLSGLKQVVRGIRQNGARPQPIKLLFAASRVPKLDDEHGQLRHWLRRSNIELENRGGNLLKIEHYDSLMLLDQAIFVLDRPKTSLAKQYRLIASNLARLNSEDADGAFEYLSQIASTQGNVPMGSDHERPDLNRMDIIGRNHSGDAVVQWVLARAYRRIRSLKKSLEACELAIAAQGKTATNRQDIPDLEARIRYVRMKTLAETGSESEAREEAGLILSTVTRINPILIDCLVTLSGSTEFEMSRLLDYPAFSDAAAKDLFGFADQLSGVPGLSEAAAAVTAAALKRYDTGGPLPLDDVTSLQLCLFEARMYCDAVKLGDSSGQLEEDLHVAFNTAMADWGCSKSPDPVRFANAARLFEMLHPNRDEPNFQQCKALTYAVLGNTERLMEAADQAVTSIGAADQSIFSCLTYTEVSQEEFRSHVAQIVESAIGRPLTPKFFQDQNLDAFSKD